MRTNIGSTHAAPATEPLTPVGVERIITPNALEWAPDSIDPRRAAARLSGDPTEPGPYTIRYRAPAGYAMALHLHPQDDEQLTVISGTITYSTGEAGSGAAEREIGAGGFVLTPAGTPHRIAAVTDAVIQMSGIGPHVYVYPEKRAGAHTKH
jgi:mannose-6-phosphate isomerase-like protein (cupin superfamily)